MAVKSSKVSARLIAKEAVVVAAAAEVVDPEEEEDSVPEAIGTFRAAWAAEVTMTDAGSRKTSVKSVTCTMGMDIIPGISDEFHAATVAKLPGWIFQDLKGCTILRLGKTANGALRYERRLF